MVKGYRLTG